jgi:hypothetical protein
MYTQHINIAVIMLLAPQTYNPGEINLPENTVTRFSWLLSTRKKQKG